MKKVLSVILSIVLMVTMIPLVPITASANNSDDIISIARSQIGSYGSDTNKYTSWYYGKTTSAAWCAIFVSWCANQAGVLGNAIPKRAACSAMLEWFQNRGEYHTVNSSYVPQKGDIIFFDTNGSGVTHHVELVSQTGFITEGGKKKVRCIGGNTSNSNFSGSDYVSEKNRYIYQSSCKVMGYAHPSYDDTTDYSKYTYSFDFNANGGVLGSSGAFSVSYGKQFQVLNTTCTRSGYTWAGWNVKRNNDNKWYVAGQGWCSESQISDKGYTKKAYSNYQTLTLDDSWVNGVAGNCSYTFYAVWIKARVDTLKVFLSPYGEGYDHTVALNNRTSSGYAQDKIYAWYILYDGNTGDLMNTYSNKTYSVELAVRDPNGNLVFNHTYNDSSDANWIGVTPQMRGTYTATATISGAYSGSISTTYEVYYDAELLSSYSTIPLHLNGTNSRTSTIAIAGSYPGKYGVRYSMDTSIASATWGNWEGNNTTITVTGKKVGTTNMTISLYENYTENKDVIKTITIPVTVTADTYTISYNANGGTGAPDAQTKIYGQVLTLSSVKPTRTGYTFLGWATNSTATTATYQPGDTYTLNSGATLYAVWKSEDERTGKCGDYVTYRYFLSEGIVVVYSPNTSEMYENFYEFNEDVGIKSAVFTAGSVANYTFRDCVNLNKVSLSYVKSIGNYSFLGCTSLKELELSDELVSIGTCAFGECASLEEVSLPEGLESIGNLAFSNTGLKKITIPKSVTKIQTAAFDSDVVICGYSNSVAHTYAVQNGNPFIALDAIELNENASANAVITTGGEMKYFTYTPTTNGTYVIYSIGSDDTKIYLYDANGTEIDNDGGAGDKNFRLEYDLVAGKTYMFSIKYYSASKIGTISFKFGRVYTINYDANGGSGAPSPQTKDYGMEIKLSSIMPERPGYSFIGWTTGSVGTTPQFQPGDTFTYDVSTTMYAIWKQDVTLSSISVYSNPKKTVYYIGDLFDSSGLTIKLSYSDGTTKNITNGFTVNCDTSTTSTAGMKTITVTYNGKTTSFNVTVKEPNVLLSETGKTLSAGDISTIAAIADPSGQRITWVSSNTNVATVSDGIVTAKSAGTADITAKFTYNGMVYSKTCTVIVEENISIGDLNGDGAIDAGDAVIISRYDAGLITLTAEQLKVGDVNGDGVVDAGDAVIISRYDAGLINKI